MKEVVPAGYEDILVRCPIPGKEDLGSQTLGEFMKSEVGQRVGGQALQNVELLLESGMEQDQAIIIAFGGAAVMDDSGNLLRAPAVTEQPAGLTAPAPAGAGEK